MKNYALNINIEDVPGEIWKPVVTYDGYYSELYEVSNRGRVKSLRREVSNGFGLYYTKERILKQSVNKKTKKSKYYFVGLQHNRKQKTPEVHILMADAFLEEDSAKPRVIHVDHNTLLNWVENIKRVTKSQKAIQAYILGNFVPPGLGKFRSKSASAKPIYRFSMEGVMQQKYNCSLDAVDWLISHGFSKNSANKTNMLSAILKCAKGFTGFSYGFKWSILPELIKDPNDERSVATMLH